MADNWSDLWSGMKSVDLAKEPYMWQFYKTFLSDYDFRGKKILEIGCGTGANSIIMASMGAKVTFLDKTRESLNLVRSNLNGFERKCELVQGDVFDYNLDNDYDLVHSEGVVEHFLSSKRQRILEIHAESLKTGGNALIIVPNLSSMPYRIGKYVSQKTGTWVYGNEYPYSRKELVQRIEQTGMKVKMTIGGEFIFSFAWLFAPLWLKASVLRKTSEVKASKGLIKSNYNNPLANRWGRVIGCLTEK